MKILVIDNYDSFTYNLVQIIEKILNQKVDVKRNDEFTLDEIENYDKILLSPGPGIPDEAGLLKPLIERYAQSKSILGVCLGLQAIAEVFGAKLTNLNEVFHGISSNIIQTSKESIFNKIPNDFFAGRYHSWIVSETNLPDNLEVTAIDENGNIMALSHKEFDVKGVQFHPESVLTDHGEQIIRNWLFGNNKIEIDLPTSSNEAYDIKQFLKFNFC